MALSKVLGSHFKFSVDLWPLYLHKTAEVLLGSNPETHLDQMYAVNEQLPAGCLPASFPTYIGRDSPVYHNYCVPIVSSLRPEPKDEKGCVIPSHERHVPPMLVNGLMVPKIKKSDDPSIPPTRVMVSVIHNGSTDPRKVLRYIDAVLPIGYTIYQFESTIYCGTGKKHDILAVIH